MASKVTQAPRGHWHTPKSDLQGLLPMLPNWISPVLPANLNCCCWGGHCPTREQPWCLENQLFSTQQEHELSSRQQECKLTFSFLLSHLDTGRDVSVFPNSKCNLKPRDSCETMIRKLKFAIKARHTTKHQNGWSPSSAKKGSKHPKRWYKNSDIFRGGCRITCMWSFPTPRSHAVTQPSGFFFVFLDLQPAGWIWVTGEEKSWVWANHHQDLFVLIHGRKEFNFNFRQWHWWISEPALSPWIDE